MDLFGRYHIDTKSFFKKGVPKIDDPFGVFLINGRMGTGKTYFAVKWVNSFDPKYKIKTNIKSLKIKNRNIEYFSSLSEIYNDSDKFVVYIIDELGKKYTKEGKSDKDFYNFLQMSRKNKRIVILIHQEYLQTPIWIRGVVNQVISTEKVKFLPIFKTLIGYPYLDEESKEWNIDYVEVYYYKRNKEIADLYNTLENVNTL